MPKEIEVSKLVGIVKKYGDNRYFYSVDSQYAFPEFAQFLLQQKSVQYLNWVKAFHSGWTPEEVEKSITKHYKLFTDLKETKCAPVQIWGVDEKFDRVQFTKFNFDGYHRLTACQVLGRETISCKIGGEGNQDD